MRWYNIVRIMKLIWNADIILLIHDQSYNVMQTKHTKFNTLKNNDLYLI